MCNDPECPYGELVDEAAPGETVSGTVLMQVHGYDVKEPWQGGPHIARHDPARVLPDVQAKREILERCEHELRSFVGTGAQAATPYLVLRMLARPYLEREAQ